MVQRSETGSDRTCRQSVTQSCEDPDLQTPAIPPARPDGREEGPLSPATRPQLSPRVLEEQRLERQALPRLHSPPHVASVPGILPVQAQIQKGRSRAAAQSTRAARPCSPRLQVSGNGLVRPVVLVLSLTCARPRLKAISPKR